MKKAGYSRIRANILLLFVFIGCAAAVDALRRAQHEGEDDADDAEGDTLLLLCLVYSGEDEDIGEGVFFWCPVVYFMWQVLQVLLAPLAYVVSLFRSIFGTGENPNPSV